MSSGPVVIVRKPRLPEVDAKIVPRVNQAIVDNRRAVQLARDTLYNEQGFSDSRELRHIGRLPAALYFAHPEFYRDDKALLRWLRLNPEFRVGKGKI